MHHGDTEDAEKRRRKKGRKEETTDCTDVTDRVGRASHFAASHPCYLCNPWFDLSVSAFET